MTGKQKRQMAGLFIMMLIGALLETMGTSLILPFIEVAMNPENALSHKSLRRIYDTLGMSDVNQFLIMIVIALIIVYLVKNIYLYIMYRTQYTFVYNGQFRDAAGVFRDYVRKPYEFYLDANTPVIMRHIVSDVNGVYNLILTMLQLFTELIIFAALFILSLAINFRMTLAMTLIIGLIFMINKKVCAPVLQRYGHEGQEHSALVTRWLMEAMNGMKETKVLNREGYFVRQYERSAEHLKDIQIDQNSMGNVPRLSIETVVMCGILAIVGVFLAAGGDLQGMIGQIVVLAYVATRIMPSANRITQAVNNIAYFSPCLDSVGGIIKHTHETDTDSLYGETDPEITPVIFNNDIVFDRVSYRYPNTEKDIFSGACLRIEKGKSVGIIGPSGAGKSTAVDVLLGLLLPHDGAVRADGADIRENLPGWYDIIGYVPQMMFMLDDSIRANVAFGQEPGDIDDDRVWAALKEAQLDEYVRSLPDGLDTGIGERGVRISGGQRQRIGIARALYNDPEIMIFDEATSSLDNDTETAIMDAIERLHGRKTLIIVAHRLSTIANCDSVYRVENGSFIPQKRIPGTQEYEDA